MKKRRIRRIHRKRWHAWSMRIQSFCRKKRRKSPLLQPVVLFIILILTVVLFTIFLRGCDRSGVPKGGNIVETAESQIGNRGGERYWSWYGFDEPVDWCACFVSWCADKSGDLGAGKLPKFSYCQDGVRWFIDNKNWRQGNISPEAGMIIFFDWDGNDEADHVGIVKEYKDNVVHTIEGDSGNKCRSRKYPADSAEIYGYGVIS